MRIEKACALRSDRTLRFSYKESMSAVDMTLKATREGRFAFRLGTQFRRGQGNVPTRSVNWRDTFSSPDSRPPLRAAAISGR
jgi:hypothetical protein